jgi:hypothetical protein
LRPYHVFVYDIGQDLATLDPILSDVYRLRPVVMLGVIAGLWLALGHRRFLLFVVYVLAYPFVVVFWHFSELVLRYWPC